MSSRPSSAMASLTTPDSNPAPASSSTPKKESWLRKNFMGRTPSLPTSLGRKKHSFLKVRRTIYVSKFMSDNSCKEACVLCSKSLPFLQS